MSNGLYELIRKEHNRKNRPLKIICDWDEVIQPCGPRVLYEIIREKKWYEGELPSFEDWFKEFWKKSVVDKNSDREEVKKQIYVDYARATKIYTDLPQLEKLRQDPEKLKKEFWEPWYRILDGPNFYYDAPLLSAAEALCKALDEGLIDKLAFISTTRGIDNRKKTVFNNVFFTSHPALCEVTLNPQGHHQKTKKKRCDWIKENHSDFDIFVDDNLKIISETKTIFGPEKIYVSPWQGYISDVYPELEESENFLTYPDYVTSIPRLEVRKKETTEKKTASLYELIKKEYNKKGRPLKIVSDWDDCLQPARPLVIYLSSQIKSDFKQFFKNFWENSVLDPNRPSASIIGEYLGNPEEKKAVEDFEKQRQKSKQNPKDHIFQPIDDFYNKSPFLSTAEDLLRAYKEGMIDKIVLISCYRKGKNQDEGIHKRVLSGVTAINKNAEKTVKEKVAKIKKSFGNLPGTEIEMTGLTRPSEGDKKSPEFKPYRWEVLRDKFPDFDIFIDDNPYIIKECVENLPSDKVYALCDYKCNRSIVKGDNVHMIPVTVSDLKNENFVCQSSLSQASSEEKNSEQKNPWKKPHIYLAFGAGVGVALLALGIYLLIKREKSKKEKLRK